MKTITFLRHSKSSWDFDVSDINRPLSELGINKIKKTSNSSKDTLNSAEIFFSSPANRAVHTCIIMANCLDIDLGKVVICNELYTFNMMEVFDFIRQIDNKFSNVLLIGHNPAFTEISNYFSENKILNLPTAKWFSLKFKSDNWTDIIDLKPISYLSNLKNGV